MKRKTESAFGPIAIAQKGPLTTKEYNYYTKDVLVKDLLVDSSYQRNVDKSWLKNIIKNYNPALVRQLALSEREDGNLYIIDGNHTAKATMAVIGQQAMLSAKIYTGLTVEEEAMLFNALNTNSKRVKYGEKLRARVRGGDEKTHRYIAALDKSGIDWKYKGGGKAGPFEAHKDGETLLEIYGEDVFCNAMNVLKETGNRSLYLGLTAGGLCYLFQALPAIEKERLSKTLSNADKNAIKSKVSLYGVSTNGISKIRDRAAAKAILDDYYNKHLRNKLELPPL